MFVPFLYELRSRRVPVGTHEAIALARALAAGLHDSSLEGFYEIARAILVHHEKHLDAFDEAFNKHFHGIEALSLQIHEALLEWLNNARERLPDLTEEERQLLEQFDRETLEKMFQDRLREQDERHDGGNTWIGTGGTSPFGHSGRTARPGIRVGGEGGRRSAVRVASERRYKAYRSDALLDSRQFSVALRKLRAFARDGQLEEIDIDETIDRTAKNLGELEVQLRPPRRSNTRVVLLMDVGGSMDPYSHIVSRLFTAAKHASHLRELKSYYFHNTIYDRVFQDAGFRQPIKVTELMGQHDRRYKLILVGDALMAPWELMTSSGWGDEIESIRWLLKLQEHFPASIWLNPEPVGGWWQTTIDAIRRVFPMYPLTIEGLQDGVQHLVRAR